MPTPRVSGPVVRVTKELVRVRAAFEGAPEAMAETSAKGVVRAVNGRLAALLNLPPERIAGRPLIAFVARGDCRTFRDALRELAAAPRCVKTVVRLRPRQHAPLFVAEVRAGWSEWPSSLVWTLRPCTEPVAPADGACFLGELVRSCVCSIQPLARIRRVAIVEGPLVDTPVVPERAMDVRAILGHLAGAAVHIAPAGSSMRVEAKALGAGFALVTMGEMSARLSTTAPGESTADHEPLLPGP